MCELYCIVLRLYDLFNMMAGTNQLALHYINKLITYKNYVKKGQFILLCQQSHYR